MYRKLLYLYIKLPIHIRSVSLFFVPYLLNPLVFYFLILKQPNGLYLWHFVVSLVIGPILKGLYDGWYQQILLSSKVYFFLINTKTLRFRTNCSLLQYIRFVYRRNLNIITVLLVL